MLPYCSSCLWYIWYSNHILGAHASFFISLCLLFASVGQASARIIASLPRILFTSLLIHRLVLLCIDAHCFIFWDLPGDVLLLRCLTERPTLSYGICQGMSYQGTFHPGFCYVVLAIFHFSSALAGMLLFRSACLLLQPLTLRVLSHSYLDARREPLKPREASSGCSR